MTRVQMEKPVIALLPVLLGLSMAFVLTGMSLRGAVFALLFAAALYSVASIDDVSIRKPLIERAGFAGSMLLIFVFIASIPKLGSQPVSPKYFIMAALLLAAYAAGRLGSLSLSGVSRPLLLYWGIFAGTSAVKFNVMGMVEPLEAILLLALTAAFINRRERLVLATRFVGIVLFASAAWFLLSIVFGEPFTSIRSFIYANNIDVERPLTLFAMAMPAGFTFNQHIMGYQMAAGTVLSIMLFRAEKGLFWKMVWGIAVPVVIIALFLTAQRSTIPAVLAPLALLMVTRPKKLIIALLLLLMSAPFMHLAASIPDLAPQIGEARTLKSRLDSEKDVSSRLGWQAAALKAVADNPLGLGSGTRWQEISSSYGADFSDFGGEEQAVHNSYIAVGLKLGWAGLIIVLAVFWRILARVPALMADGYAAAVGLSLIAVLIQGFFHNASIFTNEAASWTLLCLFAQWGRATGGEQNV